MLQSFDSEAYGFVPALFISFVACPECKYWRPVSLAFVQKFLGDNASFAILET